MSSLEDRVKGHKTQTLNPLENIIAVNDDGQLDIPHVKKIARAIVDAHEHKRIDWDKLKEMHNALERAEQTRKRTGSSEDRGYVVLITNVVVSLWGKSPEKRGQE